MSNEEDIETLKKLNIDYKKRYEEAESMIRKILSAEIKGLLVARFGMYDAQQIYLKYTGKFTW